MSHNKRNLQEQQAHSLPCNCMKFVCPVPGKCRVSGVAYQATVTIDESAMNEGKTEAEKITARAARTTRTTRTAATSVPATEAPATIQGPDDNTTTANRSTTFFLFLFFFFFSTLF